MKNLDEALAQLREEYSPDSGAKDRVKASLAGLIAASQTGMESSPETLPNANTPAGAESGIGTGAAEATRIGSTLGVKALKLGALLGLGTTLAVVGVKLWSSGEDTTANSQQAQTLTTPEQPLAAPLPQVPPAEAAPAEDKASTAHDGAEAAAAAALPERSFAKPPSGKAVKSRRRQTTAKSTDSTGKTPEMLAEIRLLRAASNAVRSGKQDEARHLLAQHRRQYPNSQLGAERRGLSLLLDCTSSSQGRARARRFLADHPRSPVAEKIRKQCLE